MTLNQIDQLKNTYAEMIVEGMDMNSLITFAVESIEQNLKDYDMDDLKEEIIDCYGEDVLYDSFPQYCIGFPHTLWKEIKKQNIFIIPFKNVF